MALRFGNGNALPTMPKRDAAAYGGDGAEPFVSGDRGQMPAASGFLQTSQQHESESRGLPGRAVPLDHFIFFFS